MLPFFLPFAPVPAPARSPSPGSSRFPTQVRSGTFSCAPASSGTLRPQLAPSPCPGGSNSPPREHFPSEMCPPVPTRARSGTFSCPGGSNFPPREHFPTEMCPPAPTRAHSGTFSCPGGWYFLFVKFGGITCHCQTAFYKGSLLPLRQFCSGRNTIPSQTALLWGWPFPPNFMNSPHAITQITINSILKFFQNGVSL